MHFKSRVDDVKRGILMAGGFPMELPALSLSESLQKPTTMLYRNLLAMDAEIDVPLDRSQWETLKALGAPDPSRWRVDGPAIQTLVAVKLAEIREGCAVLTAEGREAVVRGSPRLWDASG
jgi:hypothetical protein